MIRSSAASAIPSPHNMVLALVIIASFFTVDAFAFPFKNVLVVSPTLHNSSISPDKYASRNGLRRYLFGFGGGEKSSSKRVDWQDAADNNLMRQGTGEVASTATMMENFKRSQQLGKRMASLLEELSAATVTGNGPGGKVKVIFSGQQRPKGIEIDDAYLESISPDDLCADITAAMQDAHTKSTEFMQKKMQPLYAELGLPNP